MVNPNKVTVSIAVPFKPEQLLALLVILTGWSGIVLYFLGSAFREEEISAWGGKLGLFPRSADELMVLGLLAVLELLGNVINFFFSRPWWLVASVLALAGLGLFVKIFGKSVNTNLSIWVQKLKNAFPAWQRVCFASVSKAYLLLVGSLLISMAVMMVVFVMVSFVGVAAGRASYERDIAAAIGACNDASTLKPSCVALQRGRTPIACGYLLDSSPTHARIFVKPENKARSFDLAGGDLEYGVVCKATKPTKQ